MKIKYLSAIFCSAVLLNISCGGNSEKEEDSSSQEEKGVFDNISEATGALKNISKMEQYAKEMENRINELKVLTPVKNDVLKSIFPEVIANLKRSNYTVGEMSAMNVSSAKASYGDEESQKNISIDIIDGAGEAASSMLSLLFLAFSMDKEQESESGFEKTVDYNGSKAIVKQNKSGESVDSEIQWIHNDRFMVTLKGDNYTYEELAVFQKQLDLSNLK